MDDNHIQIIKICKADITLQDDIIPDTKIFIQNKIPNCETLEDTERLFNRHAEQLADALFNSLPQGIFDRLAIKLMSKKTSLYHGKTNS